ncbi:heavy metal-associated isoprenylated plant protein 6-like [Gastrolobium bilobum]|uniref:heavy metal-associated isoprenylated plant protein 6-like n=1 Tax=Gastrolobium bilobum TaxID=150636 RepID=UPI002AB2E618|nr:heavy metal-associated isoprenylated plant protein 6-like [Gastrolobium bilobum]
MGEKKEEQPKKNETEKKPDDGGAKKDDGPAPVVYKLDLHCEGCVKKIKRTVRHFEGVENVKAELSANKLTVTGKMDSNKLRDKLADKTKKNVEIVSPQPKKDASAAAEKPPEKKSDEKKPEDKKPEENKPKEHTVVLKIALHCDGCVTKIRRIIQKYQGVDSVNLDLGKDMVIVKGTMNEKELVPYLNEKLKRKVEVVPPKKDEDKKEKEKEKEKENKEGGGDKKEKAEGAAAAAAMVEVNKMEYQYPPLPPAYWYDGHSSAGQTGYAMEAHSGYDNHYVQPAYVNHGYENHGYYPAQPPAPFFMHSQPPPPQMFSDENPNSCSIM